MPSSGASGESEARRLDAADALAPFRARFAIPRRDGRETAYLCGHSLGLMPKDVPRLVEEELDDWAALGVDGHFRGRRPWYRYHERLREPLARLVGARPDEVVAMNGLTVNLHLMLVSFYRPSGRRRAILVEEHTFPSDLYAVQSQIALHGGEPVRDLIVARAREGEATLRDEDLEALIAREADRLALVLLSGVNYFTGQLFDLARVVAAAHRAGCPAGFDLAHAAGNVPLDLHESGADFAVWCSYKYLNGGPGAVAGCFVHERHAGRADLPRLAGWWGHDPERRFAMDTELTFSPARGADGWQLSNPPILAMAPLIASLRLFDEAGREALRAKSVRLTRFLEQALEERCGGRIEILTPREPSARGCQLSLRLPGDGRPVLDALARAGVVCDFRPPDVIRVAPVPLYNSFHDAWRLADALAAAIG